jgi:hypothetical protein
MRKLIYDGLWTVVLFFAACFPISADAPAEDYYLNFRTCPPSAV